MRFRRGAADVAVPGKPRPLLQRLLAAGVALAWTGLLAPQRSAAEVPQAYLRYDLYTKDSVWVKSEAKAIDVSARDDWQHLYLKLKADSTGYLRVGVVNYTDKNVWFDDLRLVQMEEMVVQENQYDPFGQNLPGIETAGTPDCKDQYTGKERISEAGLEWTDYGARYYDAQLGRWHSPDPAGQFGSPYLAMGNNPVCYVDPDGRWVHLVAGAVIGGVMNWAANGGQFNGQGLAFFAVGAVAGALGAGIGAGVSSALAGGSFGAGFMGSTGALAASTSFVSGAAIGGATGFSSGFVTGAGNSLVSGGNLNNSLESGVKDGMIGGLSGAVLGGVFGGIDAMSNDRNFWSGALPDGNDNRIWGEMTLKARTNGESSITDGHSWIETTDVNGNTTSYGTWRGSKLNDIRVNYKGDLGSEFYSEKTKQITFYQKARFDKFMTAGNNEKWSFFRNCSAFSSRAFGYTTGYNISAHPFLVPVNTPSWINKILGGF